MTGSGSEGQEPQSPAEIEETSPGAEPPPSAQHPGTPELPRGIARAVGLAFGSFSGPPWANPEILRDLEPDTKSSLLQRALDAAIRKEQHEYDVASKKIDKDSEKDKRGQGFIFAGLVLALVACFGLSWLFLSYGSKELITPVLTGLGGLGAGFVGGYGYARRTS